MEQINTVLNKMMHALIFIGSIIIYIHMVYKVSYFFNLENSELIIMWQKWLECHFTELAIVEMQVISNFNGKNYIFILN